MIATSQRKKRLYVSKDFLRTNGANFTLEGFQFHCRKLDEYTNPKAAGIDKIPLNNIAREREYRDQFTAPLYECIDEGASCRPQPERRRVFLRVKKRHQIAIHMIGGGSICYWTGSRSRKTLLGLDIDDHESGDPQLIHDNCVASLTVFEELTGWKPETCLSSRGIHGFLILDKGWFTAHQTNQYWHNVIKHINAEAKRRGLVGTLECKGKAKIVNDIMEYGGVLLKDPFTGFNPTDDEIKSFWNALEARQITDSQLRDVSGSLAADDYIIRTSLKKVAPATSNEPESFWHDGEARVSGSWIKQCRKWATHGLNQHDSMAEVVYELAKWLFFIELWQIEEDERFEKVVELLQQFCLTKHNGFITRLDLGKTQEVLSHVERIVQSMVHHCTDSAQACFAAIREKRSTGKYQDTWYLERLLLNTIIPSPVKLNVSGSVSHKEKKNPKEWVFVPDYTPLPKELEDTIRNGLNAKNAKEKTYTKLVAFINHLKANGGEARLSQLALKKMGFSDNLARKHIRMLRALELMLIIPGSPVAHVGNNYVLRVEAKEMLGIPVPDCPE